MYSLQIKILQSQRPVVRDSTLTVKSVCFRPWLSCVLVVIVYIYTVVKRNEYSTKVTLHLNCVSTLSDKTKSDIKLLTASCSVLSQPIPAQKVVPCMLLFAYSFPIFKHSSNRSCLTFLQVYLLKIIIRR